MNAFDDFNSEETNMKEYLQMRRRMLLAEAILETLVRENMVEILTNEDGEFTYRLTQAGINLATEAKGVPPTSNKDISFMEFVEMYN